MTYPEFAARWQPSGGAERANYGLFLTDLCDLIGVPRPDATTDNPAQDAYVLERAVTFDDGAGKKSTGRIDLYKRGCFVFETKQGVDGLVSVLGEIPPSGGGFLREADSFGRRIPSGGGFLREADSFGRRIRWAVSGKNVSNLGSPPKSAARATPSAAPPNGGK